MRTVELEVPTGVRGAIVDLTAECARFVAGEGDGLLAVFVPHATAGLALIELGAGTEADLQAALDRLLPRDGRYTHRHGPVGHGADHVIPALLTPSIVVPVVDGRPTLGTWQSIALVDRNPDKPSRMGYAMAYRHAAGYFRVPSTYMQAIMYSRVERGIQFPIFVAPSGYHGPLPS